MTSKLKCYWFGYGGSSWMVEKLRHLIENELGMILVTIHEHPNANIKWDLDTVFKELEKADIILVPANYKRQPCKSNNRVTQAMALRKPIICEPMPAYCEIVKNFENGIILKSDSLDEWRLALSILKEDSKLRNKLAENGYITSKLFSKKLTTKKWLNFLSQVELANKKELIDVVIPTKNNISILKECIKSFSNSTCEETIYIIDNDTESTKVEDMVRELGLSYEVREI